MKLITLSGINLDVKKVINYSDESFASVKVEDLVELLKVDSKIISPKFVHNGLIVNNEIYVKDLTVPATNAITLNFCVLSPALTNLSEKLALVVDVLSVDAAKQWSTDNKSTGVTSIANTQLESLIETFSVNTTTANVVAENVPPVQPAIRWIQFSLLLRLVVTCFVFCYNKDMSLVKQYAIGGLAVVMYLLHIGAIKLWATQFFRYLLREYFQLDHNNMIIGQDQQQLQPNNGGLPPAVVAGGQGVNVAAEGAAAVRPVVAVNNNNTWSHRIQWLIATASRLAREGVVIPTGPGIHMDILAVVIAVIGSLFPQWTPTGQPIPTWD